MSKIKQNAQPLASLSPRMGEERLRIWKKLQGSWKNRKTDPIQELDGLRRDSDRTYER